MKKSQLTFKSMLVMLVLSVVLAACGSPELEQAVEQAQAEAANAQATAEALIAAAAESEEGQAALATAEAALAEAQEAASSAAEEAQEGAQEALAAAQATADAALAAADEAMSMEEATLGTEDRPIKVLFVPSVEADAIITGGQVLADALTEATGLVYEVNVPTSYAATIEEVCASPDDTIAFIPAQGYVLANDRCGVIVGGAAVRFGLSWYAAQFVVPFDSEVETVEDLAGLSWCIPDFGSTSGYLYPSAEFASLGIESGEIVESGSHNNSMLGVYNGECDFATAFFSPPLLPNYNRSWTYGADNPEIWREAGVSPERTEAGRTFVGGGPDEGGYRILDARSSVSDTAPDIFDQTRIVALTDQIPNDTVSFGPEFPLSLSNDIIQALIDFTASEACANSICSEDFYNWTGLEQVTDSFYDPVRSAMSSLGITEEEILGDG